MSVLDCYPKRAQRPGVTSQLEPAEALPEAMLLMSVKTGYSRKSTALCEAKLRNVDIRLQHSFLRMGHRR